MQNGYSFRIVWTYLLIVFTLGILLSVFISLTGGHTSKWINVGYLSMFIPVGAVLIIQFLNGDTPRFEWRRFPLKWLPVALFIFPVIIHAVCLVVIARQNHGHIPWRPWLSGEGDGLFHTPPDKNWGNLSQTNLIIRIVVNAVVGLLVVSLLAFFEEIGWRAWLLPRLIKRFGIKKGIIIAALVCALWHLPYSLSGIHYIQNIPLSSAAPLEFLGQVGVAIVLGWLWIKTTSIWIVSIAHGALNNWGQYAFKFIVDTTSPAQTLSLFLALNLSLFLSGLIILFGIHKNKSSYSFQY